MSINQEQKVKKKSGVSEEYRLVIYRSDDFQEVRSFNLSLGSIYIFSSIVILVLCVLIFLLLSYTPMKRFIPGYGKLESNQQLLELVQEVDEISEQIEAQSVYLNALRKLLGTGLADQSTAGPLDAPIVPNTSDLASNVINAYPPAFRGSSENQQESIVISEGTELYDALADQRVRNPVNGLISSEFDPDIKHYGVDVLAPANTPVLSMMDGFVFSSGWDLETGYSIGVQHDNNILSFYKHNSQLLKEKGTFVRAGEAVAIIGNTGTLSNGPHLHFEIWHNGKPVNPQEILNFN